MAVEIGRTGWLPIFESKAPATSFFTRLFKLKQGSIFNGTKIAIDIKRFGRKIAIAVKRGTGPRMNTISLFTTKEYEPFAYDEAMAIISEDLLNRPAGSDPFSAAYEDYAVAMNSQLAENYMELLAMIQRAVELQGSQVMQTATVTLTNAAGDTVDQISYLPKATHFPQVSVSWSSTSNTIEADLRSLINVIVNDGKVTPNMAIMGETALLNFQNDATIQTKLDNRRMTLGEIAPSLLGSGVISVGRYWIGNYPLDILSYEGRYEDPASGNATKYMDDNKVILMANPDKPDGTDLTMASARVPRLIDPDPRVASMIPSRVTSIEGGYDIFPNAYPSNNGKQIITELESRVLLIPTGIDQFGCLNTVAP